MTMQFQAIVDHRVKQRRSVGWKKYGIKMTKNSDRSICGCRNLTAINTGCKASEPKNVRQAMRTSGANVDGNGILRILFDALSKLSENLAN